MRFTSVLATLGALYADVASAQQYAGEVIDTSLPSVPGSEIAYFKIPGLLDGSKTKPANLTLINYYSHGADGKRLVESKVQRAIIIIHGLNRDPGTYQSNMQSALSQVTGDKNINKDSVAIMSPYFPNGDDKDTGGYPWNPKLAAGGARSYTSAMVWKSSQWSAGGNNQYPYTSTKTSSFTVLDNLVQYFDNQALFPNMKQIIVAGHSLGAQTVHRYAAIGNNLNTKSPVTYWIGNPNSYIWLSLDRPLSTAQCPEYDIYRDGYTNFTEYPMTYGQSLVDQGRSAILANYNRKQIAYARGTRDKGDDSSGCAPTTVGGNRNERFFNFIKAFPATCNDPSGGNCDTVDFVDMGHDAGGMMASAAGKARLFTDNFYGNGNRSYDFGYPRFETFDDPYPNPALNDTSSSVNNNVYEGNLTYAGCWSDGGPYRSLSTMAYDKSTNTIELCTSTCVSKGFSIAGVEFGSQCYCGNYLASGATKVLESACTTSCSGNSSETCGNNQRLSLFSNGEPTVLKPASTPETIGDYTYLNCYTDNSPRTLTGKYTSGSFMTLDFCANYCSGYIYFGTEYASECYCSNTINDAAKIAPASDCGQTCANNTSQYCGSGNRLTIYTNPNAGQSSGSTTTSPSGSSTSTSSSSTSSASAGNSPSCPASDGTVVKSNGLNFTVECGIDHAGGDLSSVYVSSFQECIDACSSNSQCVDVSLSGTACYLKKTLGAAGKSASIWGAKLLTDSVPSTVASTASSTASSSTVSSASQSSSAMSSPSSASATPSNIACPSSDGTTHTASSGRKFTIECGIDHQAGDMGSKYVNSFQECIDVCDQTAGCVDVSLSGTACYLKSTLGAARDASGIWGAKLASPASSSSSSGASVSSTASIFSSIASSSSSASTAASQSSSSTSTSASASATATTVSCPASDNTVYTVSSGNSFLIECGVDHQGGDLSSKAVNSFAECISACDTTATCIDVSMSGNMCYLKSSVGSTVKLDYIWGAKLVPASSSSSSSASVSASSASASASASSSMISSSSSSAASSSSSSSSSSASSTSAADSTSASSSSQSRASVSSESSASSTLASTTSSSSLSSSSQSQASSTSPVSTSATSISQTTSQSEVSSASSSMTTLSTSASSAASSSTASASAAALPSGFSYTGCFNDGSARAFPVSLGASSTQTQQQCAMSCQTKGYKYSGTEYANECWCGNSLPSSPAPESQCSMACKGDSTQKCGAGNRLSVVSDDSWKQTFFATQNSGPWNLLGCYTDSTAKRSLPNSVSLAAFGGNANATISNCMQACQARGFSYCGEEYYSECFGSNTAPATNLASGADPLAAGCNYPCKGNSSESCGGSSRIIVYTTQLA